MNRQQCMVLWSTVTIVVLLALFPPWEFAHNREPYSISDFGKIHSVLNPPYEGNRDFRINTGYLFARWFIVVAVGSALFLQLGKCSRPVGPTYAHGPDAGSESKGGIHVQR